MADNVTMLVFNKDEGLQINDILETEKGQEFLDQIFQYLKEKIENPETKFIETIANIICIKYENIFRKCAEKALEEYFRIEYYINDNKKFSLSAKDMVKRMTKELIEEKLKEENMIQHITDEIIKDPNLFPEILNSAIHETLISAFMNSIRENMDFFKYTSISESRSMIMNEISTKMQQYGINFQN